MPLTQVDAVAALVIIDLQKGIVARQTAHPASEIVSQAARLAEAFRRRSLPVALVNVAGRPRGRTEGGMPRGELPPDWAELVPELGQQPNDILITKNGTGAFTATNLEALLRERGVTQVFLAGIATSVGVESTARVAFDLGYNVVFITDAMTDLSADSHRNSVERVFPRLGELDTTAGVLAAIG